MALLVLHYYLIIRAAELFHFHQVSRQSQGNFRSINYGYKRWGNFTDYFCFRSL